MRLEFSPYIAFHVKDYGRAVEFYRDVMGMQLIQAGEAEAEFKCGPITIFVEPGDQQKVFFEFKTDDLASAKEAFVKAGCRLEATKTPEGQASCFVFDPFGMIFHLWQESS
jgi:predicted enzyme related to lactoylglutathione lyase